MVRISESGRTTGFLVSIFFRVISPIPENWDGGTIVSRLICPDTRQWDRMLLEQVFNVEEVELIQGIPLSVRNLNDRLIWHHEQNGRSSIRSA